MEEGNIYAFLNGELVFIDDLGEEDRHKEYICPSCGCKMDISLWQKNKENYSHVGYFRHVDAEYEHICNGETYKHEITKFLFKKYFDKSETVLVNINDGTKDLKKMYQESKVEGRIGKYVADVLLSGENDNLLVEIVNTHACSEEKINSGYKIIEFDAKPLDIEEINNILTPGNGHVFTPSNIYGFKKKYVKPSCTVNEIEDKEEKQEEKLFLSEGDGECPRIEIVLRNNKELMGDEWRFYYEVVKGGAVLKRYYMNENGDKVYFTGDCFYYDGVKQKIHFYDIVP